LRFGAFVRFVSAWQSGIRASGSRFDFSDYWNMYRARGAKLALNYFINAHLFDLQHGTDTHQRVPLANFPERAPGVTGGPTLTMRHGHGNWRAPSMLSVEFQGQISNNRHLST
jgi:hypothetical protein